MASKIEVSDFVEWNGGYHTDYTYEVLLKNKKIIRCYAKGGLMWDFETQKSYSQIEIEGIRIIDRQGIDWGSG